MTRLALSLFKLVHRLTTSQHCPSLPDLLREGAEDEEGGPRREGGGIKRGDELAKAKICTNDKKGKTVNKRMP